MVAADDEDPFMKLSLAEAARAGNIDRVVVRSLDQCVYTAAVIIAGEECALTDAEGRSLRARNLLDMRQQLAPLSHLPATLRQLSAYDEMVGQPAGGSNALEIPLALAGVEGDMLH
jgi:hypothetical protein